VNPHKPRPPLLIFHQFCVGVFCFFYFPPNFAPPGGKNKKTPPLWQRLIPTARSKWILITYILRVIPTLQQAQGKRRGGIFARMCIGDAIIGPIFRKDPSLRFGVT
ncbi:MAG: hypothetical protein KIH69_018125, partial [Anaerolineae bacterium]|nr:hypothetical protein [Anaerolineae bacterium]